MITGSGTVPSAIIATAIAALLAITLTGCQLLPARQGEVVGIEPTAVPFTSVQPPPAVESETPTPGPRPSGTPAANESIPETIERALENGYANVDWFQGQVAVTTEAGGSAPLIVRQWYKQPNQMKLEVVKSGASRLPVGTTLIYNGKGLTIYDPAADQVAEIADPQQVALFLHLPQQRYSPALQLIQLDDFISTLNSDATVTLGGAGTIAGRDARVVRLTPTTTAQPFREVRLWLDRQTMVPLRIEATGNNGTVLITVEYLLFDQVTQVSDDAFSFKAPTNTKTIQPTVEEMAAATGFQPAPLPEIQGRAGYPILQPTSLPSGTAQKASRYTDSDGSVTVALFYGNPQTVSTVLVEGRADLQPPALRGSESITQGGFSGRIYETRTVVALDWLRGDTALSLVSTLPRGEAIKIANSVQ